ncbi:MAG: YceI family protein [Hyphomonadaceae bacterium]
MIKRVLVVSAALALAACSQPQQQQTAAQQAPPPAAQENAPDVSALPAGEYRLDPAHASLIFRVDHLGFSNYTGRFTRWDATLNLDPANPGAATVTATIDPRSLDADRAPAGFLDDLRGADWLNAAQFPQMTFRSTSVEVTGPRTARITGDFTFRGVTAPVTLEARFNGGYAGHPLDPNARIGFSARGTLNRSAFGLAEGIPAPGTTMGVSDAVEFIIESEFSGPAWTPPADPQQAPAQ